MGIRTGYLCKWWLVNVLGYIGDTKLITSYYLSLYITSKNVYKNAFYFESFKVPWVY